MRAVQRNAAFCVPRGFTLIEVVIALTLVSLVMLGLVSALGTLGETATKLEERAGRSTQARLVADFLRSSLSSAIKDRRQLLSDGSRHVYFHGTPNELIWLGNMPARHGIGGLNHFRLSVMSDAESTFLALQYAPYVGDEIAPDWSQLAPHILAEGAGALHIAYQSKPVSPKEEAEWFAGWDSEESLPGRVRLDIDANGQRWSPLFVTLDSTEIASRSGSRIVRGAEE